MGKVYRGLGLCRLSVWLTLAAGFVALAAAWCR
jgi:hypothetical protein